MPPIGVFGSTQSTQPPLTLPSLEYLAIINENCDSSLQDSHHILCFCAANQQDFPPPKQKLVISTLRGIHSFASEFSADDSSVSVVKSLTGSILSIKIEPGFNLFTLVTQDPQCTGGQANLVMQAMTRILQDAHHLFAMHNTSLKCLTEQYSHAIVCKSLDQFYGGLLASINAKSTHRLDYKGFLGLLGAAYSYKESNVSLDHESAAAISSIFERSTNSPCGMVIANFSKALVKKYGALALRSGRGQRAVSKSSLVGVYNWLESLDISGKLDTATLTDIDNAQMFNAGKAGDPSSDAQNEYTLQSPDTTTSTTTNQQGITYHTLINLPVNATMSTVASGLDLVARGGDSMWTGVLGLSSAFKNLYQGATVIPSESQSQSPTDALIAADEDRGKFLIGFVSSSGKNVVYRKMIHVDDTQCQQCPYHVVIYVRQRVMVALLYDVEQASLLLDFQFYHNLVDQHLLPISTYISMCILRPSADENYSLGLSRFSNGSRRNETNFFYIIFNTAESSFQTGLGYLRWPKSTSVISGLHDQLTSIFALPRYSQFFGNPQMTELFHKFTGNDSVNWLFYFIKHQNRQIIIIEKQQDRKERSSSLALNHMDVTDQEGGLAYPRLGFLENLGGDVRQWLGAVLNSNPAHDNREAQA